MYPDIYTYRPQCWERFRTAGEGGTEDEMVRWYHQLNGHEFEETLGDSKGQGSLACCNPMRFQSSTCLSHWTTTMCKYTDIHLYVCFCQEKKKNLSHYLMQRFTLRKTERGRWTQKWTCWQRHPYLLLSQHTTHVFFLHMNSHWEQIEDKLILQRFTYMIEWRHSGSHEPSNVTGCKEKVGWVRRWRGNPIVTTVLLILSHNPNPLACLSIEEASGLCNHYVAWRIC